MVQGKGISRFGLYGEGNQAIAPEFLHMELISARSRLYEWTIAPHAHPGIFQLLFLQSGGGMLATEGMEAVLAPPALVLLPAGCVHAFRFDLDAEGWVLSIAADMLGDPRIAALCAPARQSGVPRWAMVPELAGRLSWLMADMAHALSGDRSRLEDGVVAQLALVLALAHQGLNESAQAGAGRGETLVRRFRDLVERHFRDGWAVGAYAAALGVTAPTLTRAIRLHLDRAPGEVVLDRILLEAMRALTYSTATVGQIADDLGFTDPAYFARFFKGRSGMTASAFRHQRGWLGRGP